MTVRYEVQIVNPATGRPKVWATHDTREPAEVEAAKLRRHGFWVQVRRIEVDDDQHAPDRHEEGGKALALWFYNIGARSMYETIAQFRRNPAWRSA